MYNECKNNDLPKNVYVNDTVINKKRLHGSLTYGIYSNMLFALNNFDFDYFLVASSRNLFTNDLSIEKLNKLPYLYNRDTLIQTTEKWENKKNGWHWGSFKNTLLAKFYLEKNMNLYASAHEGVVFSKKGCETIIFFLESNTIIKNDIFGFNHCVEEFALQTIVVNNGDMFYYIGNGVGNDPIGPNNVDDSVFKFLYKVNRI